MFDIHIFTLYALNQTTLKKVKEKGKSKGNSIGMLQKAVLGNTWKYHIKGKFKNSLATDPPHGTLFYLLVP